MDFPYLSTLLYNVPLLMTLERAEVLESVFRAHMENPAAVLGKRAELQAEAAQFEADLLSAGGELKRTDAGYYLGSDGLARVPMLGTFVQRGGELDAMSGMQGYNRLQRMIGAAMADPLARGILLEVDSPGGSAAGAFDLAAQIRAWSREKPIHAYANERAQSAAYLLASAADVVTMPRLGNVGSIGVIALHADQSERDKRNGVKYTPIFAGKHKVDLNQHFPLSEDARERVQAMVNESNTVFVEMVASNRRTKPEKILDLEAGTFRAADALTHGLIDGEGNLAAAVARLSEATTRGATVASGFSPTRAGLESASTSVGETVMPPETGNTAAPAAAAPAQPQPDFRAEERARINAILGAPEAKGREKLAQHLACATSMSAPDAIEVLKSAAIEQPPAPPAANSAGPLGLHMQGVENPNVGADVKRATGANGVTITTEAGGETEEQIAASIIAFAPKPIARAAR